MTPAKSGSRRRVQRPARAADVDNDPEAAADFHPRQDWSSIAVGSAVEVFPPTGPSYKGRVDAKTPDSAILWIVGLAGTGRRMHGHREGVQILVAEA
ncbi:hypothetical protein [Pseudarthrobacter sp. fls2-241-R2A-168]|uniref:hypothetical protein n=1 Tax=Pseudarthrobacter sp. fls2-241-R2A-168 TaxID=3040304 RepID=UPI0025546F21|nr:hypothetical protein [Pseudarthrobacter sp. fls2-241-R2A-168]